LFPLFSEKRSQRAYIGAPGKSWRTKGNKGNKGNMQKTAR
jgi:hypothetical protein